MVDHDTIVPNASPKEIPAVPFPMVRDNAWLVFAIHAGKIEWHSSHETRDEAVEHLNHLRPDGSTDDVAENAFYPERDAIEFAFIVASPHFVSFV